MSHRIGRAAALLIAAGALWSACGGDGGDDAAEITATPDTPAATVTSSLPSATPPGERAAAICALDPASVAATVEPAELTETSGIVASATNRGVLWAHNDSGDVARAVAVDPSGAPRGVYAITGAEAIDWEDMALGPGPLGIGDALYFGDIGDNAAMRAEILVYRVAEPALGPLDAGAAGGTIAGAERITLRYPDGPHDAETLMADPLTGDLIIVTKEIVAGDSGIYVASADALATGSATLERAGTITKATLTSSKTPPDDASALVRGVGWLPTGGDISRDGALIAIRTYASVFIWAREDDQTVAETLAGAPCEAPSAIETQGEAIAFTPEGDGYYTVSEGANPTLYRFGGD